VSSALVASPPRPGLVRRATALSILPANLIGAVVVYLYFTYVDPLGGGPTPGSGVTLLVFLATAGVLLWLNWFLGARWVRPIRHWRGRIIRQGVDPATVPAEIRRRVLNAALANAVLSLAAWTVAGVVYFLALRLLLGAPTFEAVRILLAIVLVGGPVTAALAFLVSEYHWRREIPLFFPDGQLERDGVLTLPIRMRLAVTFLLTSLLPVMLLILVDITVAEQVAGESALLWARLVRAQLFLVAATGVASTIMALLVARFINRPVQALRGGMARVAAGDFDAAVPVRSTDELGEMNQHFNRMVAELRQAARARELFGRFVPRAVAREALERGLQLGGEVVHATAVFVDLRGFTALTERMPAPEVVRILNAYYAAVERVCDREGGVITQFLGDGVVVVFGGPLRPVPDHAVRAVRAAVELERALAHADGLRLEAGIGICTGDMIAGNIRGRERVVYTIVGDAVNQAARLQVKTRDLGARILLTGSTRGACGDLPAGIRLRPCGQQPLRGFTAPVEVWAVEGELPA